MPRTGPKTELGKAVARLNGARHGLRSGEPVVLEWESESEWGQFRDDVVESLKPEGKAEEALAERVALMMWRPRRVTAYETESVNVEMGKGQEAWELAEDQRKQLATIPF
jgi:hypothetical protein